MKNNKYKVRASWVKLSTAQLLKDAGFYYKGKGNMKHVVKAISLTCDGCGQQFETLDGMVCYADDEDGKLVEETACNSDWKIMNGHHYCPSCWERDDDDIIHTKDGRKWDDSSIEVVEVTED